MLNARPFYNSFFNVDIAYRPLIFYQSSSVCYTATSANISDLKCVKSWKRIVRLILFVR